MVIYHLERQQTGSMYDCPECSATSSLTLSYHRTLEGVIKAFNQAVSEKIRDSLEGDDVSACESLCADMELENNEVSLPLVCNFTRVCDETIVFYVLSVEE